MTDSLFMKMNRPGSEPTPLAQKHCAAFCTLEPPKADQPFEVSFRVGAVPHPMENEHAIQFIEFFVGDLYVARTDFIPVIGVPEGSLTLKLPVGKWNLRAVTRCNMHGLWESKKEIIVIGDD